MKNRYQHKVQYYETDRMQITHHSNYIRIMEEARTYFLEQMGWGYDRFEAEGIVSPVIHVTCDYKKTTTYPDVVEVETEVLEAKGIRLYIGYTMYCRGEIVCIGKTGHCFLDREGNPISYKKAYPEFYRALNEDK